MLQLKPIKLSNIKINGPQYLFKVFGEWGLGHFLSKPDEVYFTGFGSEHAKLEWLDKNGWELCESKD